MKCPKCGAKNGESNRFCRACGSRLEGQIDVESRGAPEHEAADELALGEMLFEVWQLYSAGELDAAMEMIQQAKRDNPDSASVNSLLALVYERKAETELDAGNVEAARELLENAVGQYERIVGFTPATAEDRERLASLKRRAKPDKPKPAAEILAAAVGVVRQAVQSVPWYGFAAALVFLLVIVIAIVAWPGKPRKEPAPVTSASPTIATEPQPSPPPLVVQSAAPPQAFTFPSQGTGIPPVITPPPPAPEPAQPQPETIQPVKLPPLPPLRVTTTPAARTPGGQAARPATPKTNEADSAPEEPPAPVNPDGATLLARAISLRNQGQTQEALITAQQAILLFEREAVSGRNPVAANRGAENARKMIAIWQSGGNRTGAR